MAAKHQIIYDAIIAGIGNGRYPVGDRLPTECELAGQFDVSRQTVLKALNTLKSQGILIGHQGKGTYVAEKATKHPIRTRQIAFVCSNLQDSFGHRAMIGIEAVLGLADYSLITCNTANNSEKESVFLRRLQQQQIDGIIMIPYLPEANVELVKDITTGPQAIPLVCLDRGYADDAIPVVQTNNYTATHEAVSYLIDQGHRRIGFITNLFSGLKDNQVIHDRYNGYRAALRDHNIEMLPSWIQELGPELANRRPREVGLDLYSYQPMHRMLSQPQAPTAVFLLWDELAPGALAAIRNSGLRCPEDISLIGFNDDALCTLTTPQLTTIRQPAEEMGRAAAELLLNKINGEPTQSITLESGLIKRHSVNGSK